MHRISALIFIAAQLCTAQEGTRVYIEHCQQCHDQNSDAHAPLREALAAKSWEQIVKALETGSMRAQGVAALAGRPPGGGALLGKSRSRCLHSHDRILRRWGETQAQQIVLERMEHRQPECSLSVRRSGRADRGASAVAQTQVGVRIPRDGHGVWPTDRRRRPGL